jgi:hypothetical protein
MMVENGDGVVVVPRFDAWMGALEAGLVRVERLVAWADGEIARLERPPLWLIELAVAKDVEGVRRAWGYAPAGERPYCEEALYIGALYLAYEAGRMGMLEMLLVAGDYADPRGGWRIPACEVFFTLANEVHGKGVEELRACGVAERVREVFAPYVADARAAMVGDGALREVGE